MYCLQTGHFISHYFMGFESAENCRPTLPEKPYQSMAICYEARYSHLLSLPETAKATSCRNSAHSE
jgi:hypothetical protein